MESTNQDTDIGDVVIELGYLSTAEASEIDAGSQSTSPNTDSGFEREYDASESLTMLGSFRRLRSQVSSTLATLLKLSSSATDSDDQPTESVAPDNGDGSSVPGSNPCKDYK
ncbi:hypothetical protein BGX28_004940 [Mortierella sp. GBA30]|nr:hypothetical protein BGX28_004940 [Mortierella sp. GBA30]